MGIDLPADVPSDLPLYPDGDLTLSTTGGRLCVISLNTPDFPEKAWAFYRSGLAEQGLTEMDASQSDGGHFVTAGKDGAMCMVTITVDAPSRTTINFTIDRGEGTVTERLNVPYDRSSFRTTSGQRPDISVCSDAR
ncbi:MAG: hypothetical protein KF774_05020 [Planctomyces sp.]|nr:hypothetical protein [Planctomyces sp.]